MKMKANSITRQDVEKKYNEIISSYIEIKPVLKDLYERNGGEIIDGIFNEIRALNDHIARCYQSLTNDQDIYIELCKAEGHLKRLIYDTFKQLNIIFYDYMAEYEDKHFGEHWISLDKGGFWRNYLSKRNEITLKIEEAKNQESKNSDIALDYFQESYVLQGEVYDLLDNNKQNLELSWLNDKWQKINSWKGWIISTFVLAVVPSLLWEAFINWSEIYIWICTSLSNIILKIIEVLTKFTTAQ